MCFYWDIYGRCKSEEPTFTGNIHRVGMTINTQTFTSGMQLSLEQINMYVHIVKIALLKNELITIYDISPICWECN